jgi:heat shock protein HslJ
MKNFLIALGAICMLSACTTKMAANSGQPPLEGTYWVLTELQGKKVTQPDNGGKPYFIYFSKDKSRVSLSGGCNIMGGSYQLMEGNRIKFGNMMSTRMACPDMTVEEALSNLPEMVDNYAILGDELMLAKARMAPYVRFKAAEAPKDFKGE